MASSQTLTVSQLVALLDTHLKTTFANVSVTGEIKQITKARSGHWYLTLTEGNTELHGVMFRSANEAVSFPVDAGTSVQVTGHISLYREYGRLQILVTHMTLAGEGEFWRLYEALKRSLQAEGLFAQERKQRIPRLPQHIAIITSATGAVIHDVLSVMKQRNKLSTLTLVPTQVQGAAASADIVAAFAQVQRWNATCRTNDPPAIDCILLCRGGGSIQDLWSFNSEEVVRCIAACRVPVVSAVGHESDHTLADSVADARGATPTAAATMLTEAQAHLAADLIRMQGTLDTAVRRQLQKLAQQVDLLAMRVRHPSAKIDSARTSCDIMARRLASAMRLTLTTHTHQLHRLHGVLAALGPEPVLARGYCMLEDAYGNPMDAAHKLKPKQQVLATLHDGQATLTVAQRGLRRQGRVL